MARQKLTLKERLFKKAIFSEGGCIEWSGATNRFGYGLIWYLFGRKGKFLKAHRVSYEYFNGSIPEGMFVCHTCDNPKCVNPDHLFIGTARDNTIDCIKKGRFPSSELRREVGKVKNVRGEQHCCAKLTEENVREIKKLKGHLLSKEIAQFFGVKNSTICDIYKGRTWKHIKELH